MSHLKSLLCTIKYITDTKDYCYQMKPEGNLNEPWELCDYSDADYTGNNNTQKSVTRYTIISNEVVIT